MVELVRTKNVAVKREVEISSRTSPRAFFKKNYSGISFSKEGYITRKPNFKWKNDLNVESKNIYSFDFLN